MKKKLLLLFLLFPMLCIAKGRAGRRVSEYGLSVTDFGAVPDGHTDNTVPFQKAIDSCAVAGGPVLVPAGQWLIAGSLHVKPGVTLRGTNEAPLSPYQLTGAIILATGGRDNEDGPPLFECWNASCVKGITVYYPDQRPGDIHAYPWTFYIRNPPVQHSLTEKRAETFDVTIEAITLINSYNGIRCGPQENGRHRIRDIAGCVLRRGILVDWTGDVGRIEDVQFHSHFWFHPATGGNWDAVFAYMQQHLEAFIFGRSDWEYVANTFVFPAKTGYLFIQTPNGACNGEFSGIGADATQNALVVQAIQSQGLQITNGEFNSHQSGTATQVVIEQGAEGSVRFTNCGFWGAATHNADIRGNCFVSFSNCYFSSNYLSPDSSNYAIQASAGKLQVEGCTFDGAQTDEPAQWSYKGAKRQQTAIHIAKGARHAIITGNNGFRGLQIKNEIGIHAIIKDNESATP